MKLFFSVFRFLFLTSFVVFWLAFSAFQKPHKIIHRQHSFAIPEHEAESAMRSGCDCDSVMVIQKLRRDSITNFIVDDVTVLCRHKPEMGVSVFIKWADKMDGIKAYATNGRGMFHASELYDRTLTGKKISAEIVGANGTICKAVDAKYP